MTEKNPHMNFHGFEDGNEAPDWLNEEFTFSFGSNSKAKIWKKSTTTFGIFLKALMQHDVGKKDGSSFLQGSLAADGIARRKLAVNEINLLALDIDTGEPIADMIKKIQDAGFFSIIYTSHSHMRNTTNLQVDMLTKKLDKDPGYEFSVDEICDFLVDEKGYHDTVLDGEVTLNSEHNENGNSIVVMHNPMPRYRAVFVLYDPFFPAQQEGCTHQEGMQVWAKKYAGFAQMLDVNFDASCTDVSRLYYRPRHANGAEFETHMINGKPVDLMKIEDGNPRGYVNIPTTGNTNQDKILLEAAMEESRGGRSLDDLKFDWLPAYFGRHPLFNTYDFFATYCEERGEHIDGKGSFECPFDEDHSDAGNEEDVGFYAANPGCDSTSTGEGGPASCQHASCTGTDRLIYIDRVMQDNNLDEEHLKQFTPDVDGGETVSNLSDLLDEDVDVGDYTKAIKGIGVKEHDFEEMNDDTKELVTRISLMKKYDPDALDSMMMELIKLDLPTAVEQLHLGQIAARGEYGKVALRKTFMKMKRDYVEKNESVKDAQKNKEYPKKTIKALREMNKEHATIIRGSSAFIMRDQAYKDNPVEYGLEYLTPSAFAITRKNKKLKAVDPFKGEEVYRYATDVWLEWAECRQYAGVTFNPSVVGHVTNKFGDEWYNLWNGWNFEGSKKGSCELLLDHIYDNICSGNDTWYDFFMSYFAHLVQRPEEIPGCAIVIQGEKGCGKSIVLEEIMVEYLFNPYGMVTSNIKDLFGNFNARVENKLLIIMTEAFWGGDKTVEAMLKDAITGSSMVLKLKGIDDTDLKNYRRFCCTANAGFVVPATHDERRFFVLKCMSTQCKNPAYFEAMMKQLEDGGFEKFMHMLETWEEPEEGWSNYFYKPPETPWLKEQIDENKASWEKWIDNLIYEGSISAPTHSDVIDIELNDTEPTIIKQKDMNDWWRYNTRNNTHQSASKKCTAYMAITFPEIELKKMRHRKTDAGPTPCYIFPPRDDMKIMYPSIFREEWKPHDDSGRND